MMTCKDCICYEILCQHALQDDELKLCESFKNKADFVEVVRCRNCVNFKEIIKDKAGICYHRSSNGLRGITDFCSYGVKKEGVDA